LAGLAELAGLARSLDHANEKAVGVKGAGEQAKRAFRGETGVQALGTCGGENALAEKLADASFERNLTDVWRGGQDSGDRNAQRHE